MMLMLHAALPNPALLPNRFSAPHGLVAGESDDLVCHPDPDAAIIAPAISYHHYRACSALVRRMYAWRGYRISPTRQQLDDPNHVVFGAWTNGELMATLTASRDSGSGLLADTLYAQELAQLRKPSRVVCEVTRLAVDPDCRDSELLKSLFHAASLYARAVFGGTDVVIEVNPRHAAYYRREFGFSQVGKLRTCPRVEAPAVLLHNVINDLRF